MSSYCMLYSTIIIHILSFAFGEAVSAQYVTGAETQ